jgi:hypothetical protein
MLDFFVVDQNADRLDIIDAIDERLAKAVAIVNCLSAVSDEIKLSQETICSICEAIRDYLSEIKRLFSFFVLCGNAVYINRRKN